jgi:uncharacterized membrane protein YoaK (UPF0700 family)
VLFVLFVFVAGLLGATRARILDSEAAILSAAMGVQNALVTRLSGAIVRTTHLTGVMTDLGIELARRWHRTGRPAGRRSVAPSSAKVVLQLTIIGSFVVGAMAGATLTLHISRWAMLAPAAAVFGASLVAFRTAGTVS